MQSTTSVLPERWRKTYLAAIDLVRSEEPFGDPPDPAARARVQRARMTLRRWIDSQKRLAAVGELSALQVLLMAEIPDDWRELDIRRQRASRKAWAAHFGLQAYDSAGRSVDASCRAKSFFHVPDN